MEHLEASEFALRVFLLFFPGLIAVFIINELTAHRNRTPFDILATSFVVGVGSYGVYWLLLKLINALSCQSGLSTDVVFLRALQDKSVRLSFREIAAVCVTAVGVALLLSVISKYKLFHRIARFVGISRQSGELDVWGFVFNSPDVQFATVRDYKHDLVYDGWIHNFSDDVSACELFLRDVSVYSNSEGRFLYDVGALYLSIDGKEMVIEFRDIAFTQKFLDYRKERDARPTQTASSAASSAATTTAAAAAATTTSASASAPTKADI
jgi:hypothetical protein